MTKHSSEFFPATVCTFASPPQASSLYPFTMARRSPFCISLRSRGCMTGDTAAAEGRCEATAALVETLPRATTAQNSLRKRMLVQSVGCNERNCAFAFAFAFVPVFFLWSCRPHAGVYRPDGQDRLAPTG